MNKRFKLIVGAKQLQILISALALLQTEDEVHYNNILSMTPDEKTASDLAELKTNMNRTDELLVKLASMRNQEGK